MTHDIGDYIVLGLVAVVGVGIVVVQSLVMFALTRQLWRNR